MKVLIYSDVHWCEHSSIVRKYDINYSCRLFNLIKSVSWAEQMAKLHECSLIICAGDFFDKPTLNSAEITALTEVKWARDINHVFLVGNHEMGINDLSISSTNALHDIAGNVSIITQPTVDYQDRDETFLYYIPYTLDKTPKVSDYFEEIDKTGRSKILIMHNDLKGIQMGQFISQTGFEPEDLENNFNLCLNGHLHNGAWVSDRVCNIGNLTGQNFSEDALTYQHGAYIIDLKTHDVEFYENPHAFNFYKLDSAKDLPDKFKSSAVISIKCKSNEVQFVKNVLKDNNVQFSRIVAENESADTATQVMDNLSIDHLQEFQKYALEEIGNDVITQEELSIICL